MKGYKYTIRIENYDTNESYIEYQVYSHDYNEINLNYFCGNINRVEKEINESEMQYDRTIYGKKDDSGEFLTYTYTIYRGE